MQVFKNLCLERTGNSGCMVGNPENRLNRLSVHSYLALIFLEAWEDDRYVSRKTAGVGADLTVKKRGSLLPGVEFLDKRNR